MSLARFMSWSQNAQAGMRAEALADLARALLFGELDGAEARAAEVALTSGLDDPSPVVRRALAEALAGAEEAPRHLIVALASDQSDVSAVVLSRSLALRDSDLIDAATLADGYAQAAIAIRPTLSSAVTSALAEVGGREACVAMALNPGAELVPAAMTRMIERFGEDAELREALLARDGLAPAVRHELAAATAQALLSMVAERGWLAGERAERLLRDSRDRSAVIIASEASEAPLDLARHLRRVGHLTPGVLLRSLLSGERGFFAAALADLSGLSVARVQGIMRDPAGSGFLALCEKAGLPGALAPAFRAAVSASARVGGARDGSLRLSIVTAVVDACESAGGEALGKAMALLRRFEVEAARDEARRAAEAAEQEAAAAALALEAADLDEENAELLPITGDLAALRMLDVEADPSVVTLDVTIEPSISCEAPAVSLGEAPAPRAASRASRGFRLPLFGSRAA
jgi:uncharacterized protein (DUF2336 family)